MERVLQKPKGSMPAVRRKRGLARILAWKWAYFFMLLPGLVVLLINNYIPMFGVVIAFQKYNMVSKPASLDWVPQLFYNIVENFRQGNLPLVSHLDASGQLITEKNIFGNFAFLFNSPDSWTITRNTVLYNVAFIILGLVVSVAFAIILSELRNKRTAKVYQSLMFLPYFLSWVIVGYLAYGFFGNEYGYVNKSILGPLGMAQQFYAKPVYWPFILIFFNLWKYSGYNCVVYLASITGIDTELYEAATIDGANRWQRIRHITIPMLKPLMIILTVLAIGRIFNSDFGLFYQVPRQQGALFSTTQVIDTYVYNALVRLSNVGMASAAGLFQSVVGFVCIFLANWGVRKIDSEKAVF
jgi:putative aldouronate transport system permease protein